MADVTDRARVAEIEDIRDDIALNEGLLESLNDNDDGDSDTEDTKALIRNNLKQLKKRLHLLQPTPNEDGDGEPLSRVNIHEIPSANTRPRSSHAQTPNHGFSPRPSDPMPPPNYDLVNRKRLRDDASFHDEVTGPSSKSRRTTPSSSVTAAPSPADSTNSLDSLDFDDPFITSLFGDLSKDEAERHREFWKKHEERKKQQEEDARLARILAQGQDDDSFTSTPPTGYARPSDYTQSFFKTDGSINRLSTKPAPPNHESPSASMVRHPFISNSTSVKQEPRASHPNVASIKSESAYNLSHLSSSDPYASSSRPPFTPAQNSGRIATTNGIKSEPAHYSSAPMIPGSFPGAQTYASIGGIPVYNSSSYNGSASTPGGSHRIGNNQPYVPSSGAEAGFGFGFGNTRVFDPLAHLRSEYQDPAQTKEELQDLLKHIRPDEEFGADQVAVQPDGLKVTLMPHQLYGLTWMRMMEEGTNKGGILADDMGLGKTIQSIALMLDRPPPENKHRPTLVVAPVALMHQWKKELEKMVRSRRRLNVFVLYGESRRTTWSALKAYDVVLTTYGLLTSELKRKLAWDEKLKLVPDARPRPYEECPVLGERSHFHRVILDEAQWIKNRNTKAGLAACRIQSDYRWALTGTPMQNSVEELFSLVKFCRIRPYNEWSQFSSDIARPLKNRNGNKDKAMTALQALLRAILLRRTKSSKINGEPILQLPPKTIKEERVTFDEDELAFYQSLESNAQIQFNKYIQRGGIGKNYSHALVLLLRLRQACCHPGLVVQSKDFLQGAGNLDTDALLDNAAELDQKVVSRLKEIDAFECPICMDVDENPALFPCGHALCSDCLSRLIDQATSDNDVLPTCPHCRAKIDANKITDITSFLRVHCPDRAPAETKDEEDEDDDDCDDTESESDSDGSDEGGDLNGFVVPDDFEEQSEDESKAKKRVSKSRTGKKKSKSKSKDTLHSRDAFKSLAQLRKEGLKSKSAKRKYLRRLRKNFQTSAKITKTIELLEEIKGRGKNEKTIIFSNFTSFLDLLEVPLVDHRDFRNYVRYDGSMSATERNNAVMEFTENPNCNVILVSLKAGNAGLNLTAANHVVMLDPFWNPFVEFQAADRCYRIGQTQEVTVHRVLIGEGGSEDNEPKPGGFTVEDRILSLQERKRELVETALDETAGRNVARLSVRELGYLFGLST
ncbi:hypothetical protein A1O3_03192 [Capronia epimyces CBS 606.96]|uniref:Adenosinetriphosphatase n=1 Tax=Capronia epimyces CBS 606.96 TaxID=1182542 RepID=W9YC68_9EURO|nr:uncharacterized protein A1O3_03192 [Capronia epimyces CBS 606.96]EXJ90123.1 hypothetical protein A1O3_03192 [Capronia epimyces CBS 606.96]